MTRVLGWPPLVFLGQRSYGLYVLHIPIYAVYAGFDPPGTKWWYSALQFATVIAAASASYRWFERPILRRKARFAR